MGSDLNKTKEAIAVIAGMKEVYKTLAYADEALTALSSMEATKKWLEPIIERLRKEKIEAEKELEEVRKQTERAKAALKRNVEEQGEQVKNWLAQEKKKAEATVEEHRTVLLGKLAGVEKAIAEKDKILSRIHQDIVSGNKAVLGIEAKRKEQEGIHAQLSAKIEGLKAEMRRLAGS
jgi:hypothetical protein